MILVVVYAIFIIAFLEGVECMNYSLNESRCELELFHSGDSVHAYELLGAHLVNFEGKDGAVFRVWAPNALSVSVVGSFNDWDETSNLMNKIDDGVWELFVEGVTSQTLYKYCIETPNSQKILKSDPLAFYSEYRPNNASIVYNLDNFAWNDKNWFEKRLASDKLKEPMNVYEMHLGSWKRNPDGSFYSYGKIADELIPYLKDMHYTHVQFMPITEHPFDGSWGYQTTGYFSATSRYGTPSDLMQLVDRLHTENIGVILDWVPSNFPKDDFGLAQFDGTNLYESEDPKLGERPEWGTCLFDYSRNEVLSFLVSSAMFWLEKYHIDGFRVGALSSMLYLDYEKKDGEWTPNKFGGKENLEAINFIKCLNSAIHLHHPDVMVFAEENTSWSKLTRPIEEGGLGFDYKWNMGWMNDMLNYMSLNPPWRPFNHDNLTFSFFYAFSEHFLLPVSHDKVTHGEKSLIGKMPGNDDEKLAGVRAFITYMYAHPGKKLVFMGTELGELDEWSCDSTVSWDLLSNEKHAKLNRFFKDINKFYLENKPLYELDTIWKGFDWIHHDDYVNSVIAFKRTDSEGNDIIAVCNFQPTKQEQYNIGVPKYGLYDEVFTSDRLEYGGTGVSNGTKIVPQIRKIHGCNQGLSLTLPPMGVIYLKCTGELDEVSD
jgi:1,4-alpha-glucan branching enzyme